MSNYELVYLDFKQGFDFVKRKEKYLNLEIDLTNEKKIIAFLKKYKPKPSNGNLIRLGLVEIPKEEWLQSRAVNTIMQFRTRINKVSADNFFNHRISLKRNYQGNYVVWIVKKTETELCVEKGRRKI